MKNLFDLTGKTAVVSGGSRGIGAMIARGFVENGVKVYITARKADACDAMAEELSQYGECISKPHDLSSLEGIESFVDDFSAREEKLDILVNNAGAVWSAEIDVFPEHAWDKVMDINIKAPFFLTQKFLPLMRKAATAEDPARIIMIASIDGLHVNPLETYPYAASKSGLIHLTRALAARLSGEHFTVNAIAPGPFPSKMMAHTLETRGDEISRENPRGRIGTPEDVAGTAIYLASRAGAYTNGVTIAVDGGIVAVT